MKKPFKPVRYIWQRPEWPEFTWRLEDIQQLLNRVNHLHGELAGMMAMMGFNRQNVSFHHALVDDIIGSSEIEGIHLNPESVRSSVARKLGLESDGIMATDHYVEGLVELMFDATNHCNEPLTKDRLFDWHAALFPTGRSGPYIIKVGNWRVGSEPMQVVSGGFGHEKVHYEAPPSDKVADEMKKLIDWANSSTQSPFLTAAVVHLWFVTVHPFDDGNGRIARTLADMFLSRLNPESRRYYSMSAEINRNKKSYYEMIENTQKGDLDITDWIIWFLNCLEKTVLRAINDLNQTLRKSVFWAEHEATEINERQRKIINRLWDGFDGKLTTSKWAKICHCSQDTALRDINDLIKKGILKRSTSGGRSTSYELENVT